MGLGFRGCGINSDGEEGKGDWGIVARAEGSLEMGWRGRYRMHG